VRTARRRYVGRKTRECERKKERKKMREQESYKMHIYLYVMDTIVLYVTSHGVSIHIRITKYNAKLARGAL